MIKTMLKIHTAIWIGSPWIYATLRLCGIVNFQYDLLIFLFLFAGSTFTAFMVFGNE